MCSIWAGCAFQGDSSNDVGHRTGRNIGHLLSAGDHIRNLLGRYCELIDAGDFAGVGALFEHGRLADEHGTELARGADAVAGFYESIVQLHDGSPGTKHLVLDTVLEEDAGAVVARSSYVVLQDLHPIIAGRYVDRFVEDGGQWRFAERRFAVDQAGDLSRHLRRP